MALFTLRKFSILPEGNVQEYEFKLFLPAASEVFDEDECYGDQGLYEQLDYYKDRRHRMKGEAKGEDTETYWLASVGSGNSTYAWNLFAADTIHRLKPHILVC